MKWLSAFHFSSIVIEYVYMVDVCFFLLYKNESKLFIQKIKKNSLGFLHLRRFLRSGNTVTFHRLISCS